MEPKTAFIPRKSVTDVSLSGSSRASIVSLVIVAFFVICCIIGAAVFAYDMLLTNTIEKRQEALTKFQEELKQPIVKEIKTVAARLDSAENRLKNHMAFSQVFDKLNEITLRNVRWRSFRFEFQSNTILLTLDGEAKTFASVALQADEFNKQPLFVSPIISNLNAGSDASAGARFSFRSTINPSLLSYDTFIADQLAPNTDEGAEDGMPADDGSVSGSTTPAVQVETSSSQ